MLALGTPMPAFELPDAVSGKILSSETYAVGKPVLVMFICPHCPYVKHIQSGIGVMSKDYSSGSLGIVAISSNDVAQYPDDSPEGLRNMARELGYDFPYCYDESQEAAKAYRAACTPDFFLFDRNRKLVYRGQFDSSRPKNDVPVTGADLRAAIDAVLAGRPVPQEQRPSIGCNIKWKPGNEPPYFR